MLLASYLTKEGRQGLHNNRVINRHAARAARMMLDSHRAGIEPPYKYHAERGAVDLPTASYILRIGARAMAIALASRDERLPAILNQSTSIEATMELWLKHQEDGKVSEDVDQVVVIFDPTYSA